MYLQGHLYEEAAISASQYTALLRSHLTGLDDCGKLGPAEILEEYLIRFYDLEQAARDYHLFMKDSYLGALLGGLSPVPMIKMLDKPIHKLWIMLYKYDRSLRPALIRRFSAILNHASLPREISEDQFAEIAAFMIAATRTRSPYTREAVTRPWPSPRRFKSKRWRGNRDWRPVETDRHRHQQAFVDHRNYRGESYFR